MNLSLQCVKELEYFVGKVCTVVVPTAAVKFEVSGKVFVNFFVGRVDSISTECIWMTHLVSGLKSAFVEIISIHEEQVIQPDDPDYNKIRQEYEQKVKKTEPKKPLLSIDSLAEQAKMVKENNK